MLSKQVLAALLATLCADSTLAWWHPGHEMSGQVANMTMSNAVAKENVQKLLQILDPLPTLSKATSWPDYQKEVGVKAFDNFHFHSLAITEWAGNSIDCYVDVEVSALSEISTMVATIAQPKTPSWYRAFALRMIAHMVTDIHQPFHTASRCLKPHPDRVGEWYDMGGNIGNKYNVTVNPEKKLWNMHMIWDGAAHYSKASAEEVFANAANITKRFPITSEADLAIRLGNKTFPVHLGLDEVKALNFSKSDKDLTEDVRKVAEKWVMESHALAIELNNLAYNSSNPFPSPAPAPVEQEYIEMVREAAQRRIAAGGYRLAAILDKALGDAPLANLTLTAGQPCPNMGSLEKESAASTTAAGFMAVTVAAISSVLVM